MKKLIPHELLDYGRGGEFSVKVSGVKELRILNEMKKVREEQNQREGDYSDRYCN